MNIKQIITIFAAGAAAAYLYFVTPLQVELATVKAHLDGVQTALTQEKNKPPEVKTIIETKTVAQIVPKETVIYKDPNTGEITEGKEKTDIDMTVAAPDVYMRFNSENYKLPGLPSEQHKFENSKFMASIRTDATIDVTSIVNREVSLRMSKEQKHFSAGGYVTNKGFVGSAGIINKNLEFKAMAHIPEPKKFYGGGFEIKF